MVAWSRQLRGCLLIALLIGTTAIGGCNSTSKPPPEWGPPPRLTPPMGWNSWNSGITLTEQSVKDVIDAMVSSGMRDAGYRYVNLDAGWAASSRDSAGNLHADPDRFPDGIARVARYAHDRGMLLGLYASPNSELCGLGAHNASAGHEAADARQFATWAVDYLKYDWCMTNTDHAKEVRRFTAMRDALRATGRRIIYSINPTVSTDPTPGSAYDWAGIADIVRNTIDLLPVWANIDAAPKPFTGVVEQLAAATPVAARSHAGHWNDPDMLVVGVSWPGFVSSHSGMLAGIALPGTLNADELEQAELLKPPSPQVYTKIGAQRPSLTDVEQRAQFSLWAMLAAPLLAGNDIRSMSQQTRAILTNPEIIAVDQDPLVIQATALSSDSRVMVKPLADGSVAVGLFNPGTDPVSIETSTGALGLKTERCYTTRDLWAHTNTTTGGEVKASDVPAHGVVTLRVSAACQ